MKYKVSELEGVSLDAAVAKAEGFDYFNPPPDREGWAPSRGWQVGGPILEREQISVYASLDFPDDEPPAVLMHWVAVVEKADGSTRRGVIGQTPLIAAMRAYVASKFGEEIDL